MERIETDVLILGGGWSGLVAADLLSQKGRDVVVLERETEVGGLAGTSNVGGCKFDYGGHGLFFERNENINFIKDLVGEHNLLRLKRNIKILFDTTYIKYPPRITSLFKIKKKYLYKMLLDNLQLRKKHNPINFEEWIKVNYGKCLYEIYFKEYTEKVWGMACKELSPHWADQRVGSNSLLKLIKAMIFRHKHCKYNSSYFYYPKNGIFSLSHSLEQKVKNRGCRIYKNVIIKKTSIEDKEINSLFFVIGDREYAIFFKHMISSVPIAELMKIFSYDTTGLVQAALSKVKYRSLILVNFVLDKELVTNWHWCYFSSKEVLFSRIHEPKFWSKEMALDKNTLLCMEIFCDYNDVSWNMEDEEIIRHIRAGLVQVGLFNADSRVIEVYVKRIQYAYPLHYNGFEEPLNKVKDYLHSFKNFYCIGRSGTHSYYDMEECLDDVREKVRSL